MRIKGTTGNYTLENLNIEEFAAVLLGLSDYCEKRGTDTAGYNLLHSLAAAADQSGNTTIAKIVKDIISDIDT